MAKDPGSTGLTIGELSRRTGCNIETVRYYERIGLLPPPIRSAGGRRQYSRDDVRRVGFVRRARALGFTLDDVRALLGLVDADAVRCSDVHAIAAEHLDAVRKKIDDLRRMERVLGDTVARCAADQSADCPIVDALMGDA